MLLNFDLIVRDLKPPDHNLTEPSPKYNSLHNKILSKLKIFYTSLKAHTLGCHVPVKGFTEL